MDGAAVGVAVIPVLAVSMTLAKMATTCQQTISRHAINNQP